MLKINRPEYLDFLCRSKDRQIIKVVSGVHHCGKSTLFVLYHDWLVNNGATAEQIISINFDTLADEKLTNYRTLYEHIKAQILPDKMN